MLESRRNPASRMDPPMKVKLSPIVSSDGDEDPGMLSMLYEELIDRLQEADRHHRLREVFSGYPMMETADE